MVSFGDAGTHTVQAFSTSDNSWWDLRTVTVTRGVCSVVRIGCPTGVGVCGNTSFQNFGVITASANRTIRTCVRDYECQDGDRVSVEFDDNRGVNQVIFSDQELTNAAVCRDVSVPHSGMWAFKLLALNGTGFKGNCDFSDINTGELTISGTTANVRWSVRGGA